MFPRSKSTNLPSGVAAWSIAGLSAALLTTTVAEDAAVSTPWKTSAALGLTLTSGNSETMMLNANVLSGKTWGKNELSLGADGTYGENKSVKNAESLRAYAQYNWLFADRAFGYLRVEGLHDSIADVEYRLTFSPGIGYYVLKSETRSLRVEAGPAFVIEKLGSRTHDYMTLRLAERLDWKITESSTLWQAVELLPQVDNFENFLVNAEIGVETALSEKLTLRSYIQDTYDNEPAPGREKNDVKLVTQIGYKF